MTSPGLPAAEAETHLRTRRLGLQFVAQSTEADYRRWRLDTAIPFVRIGVIAGLINWTMYLVAMELLIPAKLPAVLPTTVGCAMPLLTFGMVMTWIPRLRPWTMICTTVINSAMGLIFAWQVHEVIPGPEMPGHAAAAVMSGTMILLMLYAFVIYRLPPLQACLGVLPYFVLSILYFRADHAAGVLTYLEYGSHLTLQLVSINTGLLVCIVLEIVTRRAYVTGRLLEHQRRALMEERAQLSRFLAPEVTAMVRERGIEATLTQQTLTLTAVCCDLRGFTRYTEQQGAQRMGTVLREYYELIVEVAARHGATVKDFAGDGGLLLVGAPLPRPDHAATGVDLARDLVRAVSSMTARHSLPSAPLGVGAGVASGPCAVGAIGSQSRLEYTAVGAAVNLAARLCARAGHGEVLICPATRAGLAEAPAGRAKRMQFKGVETAVDVLIAPAAM